MSLHVSDFADGMTSMACVESREAIVAIGNVIVAIVAILPSGTLMELDCGKRDGGRSNWQRVWGDRECDDVY